MEIEDGLFFLKTFKNDSLQRVAKKNIITTNISQKTEVSNMKNEQNEVIQHIQETSVLFSRLLEKHGDYFLAEYQPHEHVMKDLFAAMSIQDLVVSFRLPNNIFRGYIETELKKRVVPAKQLKARGRLFRQEGHVCLV